MKRILSILGATSLIAVTSSSVIACSQNQEKPPVFPTWIGKIFYERTVEGDKGNTPETALDRLFELNSRFLKDTGITKNDVAFRNFYFADWENDGSVRLEAENDSKIIGDIPIKIYKLTKIWIKLEKPKVEMKLDTEVRVKILNYQDLIDPKIEVDQSGDRNKLIEKGYIDKEKGEIVIKTVKESEEPIFGWSCLIYITAKNGEQEKLKVSVND